MAHVHYCKCASCRQYSVLTLKMMALHRYFKRVGTLPDPKGPLSAEVPSSSISRMNAHIEAVLTREETGSSKRGPYTKLRSEERAQIAKRAMEHGVVRYYAKRFPGLKESSVRT